MDELPILLLDDFKIPEILLLLLDQIYTRRYGNGQNNSIQTSSKTCNDIHIRTNFQNSI